MKVLISEILIEQDCLGNIINQIKGTFLPTIHPALKGYKLAPKLQYYLSAKCSDCGKFIDISKEHIC